MRLLSIMLQTSLYSPPSPDRHFYFDPLLSQSVVTPLFPSLPISDSILMCYPFDLNPYCLHILETTGLIFFFLGSHRKTARSGEVPVWSYARPYSIGGSRLSDVD